MLNLVAVYGSLRNNEYNFENFKYRYPDLEYLSTHTIQGYDLYSFGSYPGIKKGAGELVVDILSCGNECKRRLDSMEIGAGYEIEKVTIDNQECDLYVYTGDVSFYEKVESGDWSKYLENETSISV